MVILYKTSSLTYTLATQLIKVNYLGLCNILSNSMIVPELIQQDCTVDNLYHLTLKLLNDEEWYNIMKKKLIDLKHSLSSNAIDCSITELIIQELNK